MISLEWIGWSGEIGLPAWIRGTKVSPARECVFAGPYALAMRTVIPPARTPLSKLRGNRTYALGAAVR